jgi:hypothetical protein
MERRMTIPINAASTGAFAANALRRMLPEPRSRLARGFDGVLRAASGATGSSGGSTIDPQYQELLDKQIAFQTQMQLVSLTSNSEKSAHEARMAAIRNVRTS